MNTKPHVGIEIINGTPHAVDRRVVELQPDGSIILRDPVTSDAWKTDGTPLPRGWHYGEEPE